jgi:hypothetical protein
LLWVSWAKVDGKTVYKAPSAGKPPVQAAPSRSLVA